MFEFLSRRSRPAARPTTRFIPRLEALDGRVLPGGVSGGVLRDTSPATATHGAVQPQAGEEIPQTIGARLAAVHAHAAGGDVNVFGRPAGASGTNF